MGHLQLHEDVALQRDKHESLKLSLHPLLLALAVEV